MFIRGGGINLPIRQSTEDKEKKRKINERRD
jgi:hypothetical protein